MIFAALMAAVASVQLQIACEKPAGWQIAVERQSEAPCETFAIRLSSPTPAVPPVFDAFFTCAPRGAHNIWVPMEENSERSRLGVGVGACALCLGTRTQRAALLRISRG